MQVEGAGVLVEDTRAGEPPGVVVTADADALAHDPVSVVEAIAQAGQSPTVAADEANAPSVEVVDAVRVEGAVRRGRRPRRVAFAGSKVVASAPQRHRM